jgi:hypothetical protein
MDNTNHKVPKGERCIGKAIGRCKKSIAKPSIKTKVGIVVREHGREGTKADNS